MSNERQAGSREVAETARPDDKAVADSIDESAGVGDESTLDPVMDRSMTDDEGAETEGENPG